MQQVCASAGVVVASADREHAACRAMAWRNITETNHMDAKPIFTHSPARSALALALSAVLSTLALPAAAGCNIGIPGGPVGDSPAPQSAGGMMSAIYRGEAGGFLRVDDRDHDARSAGIVGTWRFTWTSDGTAYPFPIPFGAVVDFGTQQWHDDGTEFIISGGRPPGFSCAALAV